MSIIDTFDETKPLISPENFLSPGQIARKCIVTFSCKVLEDILQHNQCTEETFSATANGKVKVYSLIYENEKILFYMSPIGAAAAGAMIDEIRFLTGANQFIVFGSCGSLDSGKTEGRIIIPTESYRDEGFSYHFMKSSDYISIDKSERLAEIMESLGVSYVTGRDWTTDSIYRETEGNVAKRRADGCICVEMECAGLQAICKHRNIDFYPFFFASDLVDGTVWENVSLGTEKEKKEQLNCFNLALQIAKRI